MNEATVKRKVKGLLDVFDVWYYMPIPHGVRGIGDFQCLVNGRFLMIETKGKGGRQSASQKLIEKHVTQHGGLYWLIGPDDLEGLETLLRRLTNGKANEQ